MALSCSRRKNSRCPLESSDCTWFCILEPTSRTSTSWVRNTVSLRSRSLTFSSSRSSCFCLVSRLMFAARKSERSLGSPTFIAAM
jgi:hypothetical protein